MEVELLTDQIKSLIIDGGPMGVKGSIEVREIPLNKIKIARNSRSNVTDSEISGLMSSIKQTGLLQPIGVTKSGTGFEIVYGNRRFLAVSKLGHSKIPAVIHSNKTESENDMQNLTENLQRRNISLTEAGRYMSLLESMGLSQDEIAARLGVAKNYIKSCMIAFSEVPEKFRNDLEVKTTNDRSKSPGKITITAAQAIISAGKHFGLTTPQKDLLFNEAKKNPDFMAENVPKYAAALADGQKDPVKAVPRMKRMGLTFWMDEAEYTRLENKHVVKGGFKSVNQLLLAVIKGEKTERIKIR